jgi:hypothetical protein
MIAGLSTFAWVHTLLSLVALVSGLVVVVGLFASRTPNGWTGLYLASAIATSLTGFGFPFERFEASHWSGVVSLALLLAAVLARYVFHLAGAARWIYAAGSVLGLYFLVFIGIAQLFKKVPALKAMAPTLSEPPFAVSALAATALFVVLAIVAAVKFRPPAAVGTHG